MLENLEMLEFNVGKINPVKVLSFVPQFSKDTMI